MIVLGLDRIDLREINTHICVRPPGSEVPRLWWESEYLFTDLIKEIVKPLTSCLPANMNSSTESDGSFWESCPIRYFNGNNHIIYICIVLSCLSINEYYLMK